MAATQVSVEIKDPLSKTFCVIGMTSFVVISIYHGWTIKKNYGFEQYHVSKFSLYLSLILMILGGLDVIMLFLENFYSSNAFCENIAVTGIPIYILFKLALYLLLVHRLYYVFERWPNELQYSVNKLKIWCILIVFLSIITMILLHIDLQIVYDEDKYPPCDIDSNEYGIIFMALQDIICGAINCYLFVRPIRKLRKKMNNVSDDFEITSINILALAIKNCILAFCAILSTVIGLIGVILVDMAALWINTDIIITILFVILS